jgi:translation initiation factor IF-3
LAEEKDYRINTEIHSEFVRLVGDNVEANTIVPFAEALEKARGLELDLVEISDKVDPPICRIIDYSKFVYEQKKKQKEMKAKAVKQVIKEIRFGPNTDEHDVDFKVKHAKAFLAEGSKIKAYVHFRGRTIIHTDRGLHLLQRFLEALANDGKPEAEPKLEGKRMIVLINPKGKKDK